MLVLVCADFIFQAKKRRFMNSCVVLQVSQDLLDPRVRLDRPVQVGLLVPQEALAGLDHQGLQAQLDSLVLLVPLEALELQDPRVAPELRVHRVHKVSRAGLVLRVRQVSLVFLVDLELLDHKAKLVRQVLRVPEVSLAQLDLSAQLDSQDREVHQAHRATKVRPLAVMNSLKNREKGNVDLFLSRCKTCFAWQAFLDA